jgi:hypothetical protein
MDFELLGSISQARQIAFGRAIRELRRLRRDYGPGGWRKMKGIGTVRLLDGTIAQAELHWYEAHGVGKRDLKVKRLLEQ